jgi:hypothetical protein
VMRLAAVALPARPITRASATAMTVVRLNSPPQVSRGCEE